MVSIFLRSHPCEIPSSECDLLLSLKVMGVASIIRLEKIMTYIFLADSVYCPPILHASIKQAAMWERPTWQGTKCGLWPIPSKELRAANNQRVSLEIIHPWLRLHLRPRANT